MAVWSLNLQQFLHLFFFFIIDFEVCWPNQNVNYSRFVFVKNILITLLYYLLLLNKLPQYLGT